MHANAEGYGSSVFFHENFGEFIGALAHIFCCPDGFHHIILLRERRSPEGHSRVTNEFIQRTAISHDAVRDQGQILV